MKQLGIILFVVSILIGCEVFTIEDISKETIAAVAPLENAELTEGEISFFWEAVENAEEYTIQIATPSFTAASEIVTDSTTTALSFTRDLDIGNYQWRVKAINSEYETAYVTNGFTVIEGEALQSTTLTTPIANAELTTGEIEFSWEEVEDAEEYLLQIATPDFDSDTFEVIVNQTQTDNSHTEELESGEYQWRVKVISDSEESEYTTQSLTITEEE